MSPRIGVLLSGCGFLDGTEIREAVLTLLALDRLGAEAVCLAPGGLQRQVIDHGTGKETLGSSRDMLAESARIARGEIGDVAVASAAVLDGLILPGGYGAAKNLSDFAFASARATVHPEVARLLREMHQARKPIGAICIAPAVVAAVLGPTAHPLLTIGDDPGTAAALLAMGARHQTCAATGCVVDAANRIVSTPAYMFDARLADIALGIERACEAVVAMCGGARAHGASS